MFRNIATALSRERFGDWFKGKYCRFLLSGRRQVDNKEHQTVRLIRFRNIYITTSPPQTGRMTEAKEKEKGGTKKTGGLGKVILDTSCLQASGGGGGCPVEKVLYVIFLATGWLVCLY